MEFFNGSSSSLRPMKRPKEYYDANDTFIVRLPSNLRGSGEAEFHIGKDIFNRSDKYAEWGGNEVLSRMQRKYCFNPTNCYANTNAIKNSQFMCEPLASNLPSSSSGAPKELIAQRSQLNDSPFNTDMPSWSPRNLTRNGSNNQRNWASSHMEPINEWASSQMAPMNNWPPKHFPPNSVGTRNSYGNNYNISNIQKPSGQCFQSEHKFNNKINGYYTRPQRRNNEPFDEFSGGQPPYSQEEPHQEHGYLNSPENKGISQKFQKEETHREYQYLNSPENKEKSPKYQKEESNKEYGYLNSSENKEKLPKYQGSKLLTKLLPIYQSDKHMITTLRRKNPKCIIFADLSHHHRFLHKLPHCLPVNVQLVIYFNRSYKFPLFVNASLEQLIKSECLHIHPVSNTRQSTSLRYFVATINRSHKEFSMDVTFILLGDDNPAISELIKMFLNCGRHVIAFMPNFDFSDFYAVIKKCQTKSSPSS